MDRLKTFAKYVAIVIAFWVFSEILINVGFYQEKNSQNNTNTNTNTINTNTVQNIK